MQMDLIDKIEFATNIVREYSSSPTPDQLGNHTCTMELYGYKDGPLRYCIEFDIPTLDESVEYGIWCEYNASGNPELVDYDGGFSLPAEAVSLLRKNGITVPEEFE